MKAKSFAERQLIIANKLNDNLLKLKAEIYIGYYFMWTKQYFKANEVFHKQLLVAKATGEKEVSNYNRNYNNLSGRKNGFFCINTT
jgi:hypothetical protein